MSERSERIANDNERIRHIQLNLVKTEWMNETEGWVSKEFFNISFWIYQFEKMGIPLIKFLDIFLYALYRKKNLNK